MIVKTGANYQAEGGYIEASKDGLEVTINDNGMKVVVPNISGNVESFIPASIRKMDTPINSANCPCVISFSFL